MIAGFAFAAILIIFLIGVYAINKGNGTLLVCCLCGYFFTLVAATAFIRG